MIEKHALLHSLYIYFHIFLQMLGAISFFFDILSEVLCCSNADIVLLRWYAPLNSWEGGGVKGNSFSEIYRFSSILSDNRKYFGFCHSFHLANAFKQGFIIMLRELYLIANDHIHPLARWDGTIASEHYVIFFIVSFINQ